MPVGKAEIDELGNIVELWHEMMQFHINADSIYKMADNASVRETRRRNGIGRVLLDRGEEWFKERGIFKAECTVSINNTVSQSFWKNNGYTGYNEICYRYLNA